jgi:hypothetical protein
MPGWTAEQLQIISRTDDLEISSRRGDGTLSPRITIWVVQVEDDIYFRSVAGPEASWFRAARNRAAGRVWSGGVEQDVRFEAAADGLDDQIDDAYRAKFGADNPDTRNIIAPHTYATTTRVIAVHD